MFDLSEDLIIQEELFLDSKIYSIDNFYKNPKEVHDYLFSGRAPLHKIHEIPTWNNVYFEDRRMSVDDDRLKFVVDYLSNIVLQQPLTYKISTNQTRFSKIDFNDYSNNYWYPHQDEGYNGIIYFNQNCECGTNLYENISDEESENEHFKPWRSREHYRFLKHIEPKYNRLVLFDGFKFLHGMNIINDRYFSKEYRKNQVFFFLKS